MFCDWHLASVETSCSPPGLTSGMHVRAALREAQGTLTLSRYQGMPIHSSKSWNPTIPLHAGWDCSEEPKGRISALNAHLMYVFNVILPACNLNI